MAPSVALSSPVKAERAAVILIVDNSGSMKASDPGGLRFTAVQMMISLLDEEDSVGVVLFSTASQPLTEGLVSISGNRTELLKRIQPSAASGYTDMKSALEAARQMLRSQAAAEGTDTSVILLTDGKPEIENPYASYEQETLDSAHALGVPIFAIGLTSNADLNFLSRLASGTGGFVIPADQSSDLLDAYLRALSAIKDRTVIGEGRSNSPGEARLEIDPALAPYVEKASFVLSKPESVTATFLTPDGQAISAGDPQATFSLLDDPRFVVVTITRPAGGAWTFELDGYGEVMARAILYSRLRSEIISPIGFQKAGEPVPIIVRLVEEQRDGSILRIIGEAEFSAEITLPDGTLDGLDRFYDDGTHGDLSAGDGEYTRLYADTTQEGKYRLAVRGRKGSVPIEQEAEFRVVRFPALVIDSPTGEFDFRDRPLQIQARLAGGSPSTLDSGEVFALVTSPSGASREIPLDNTGGVYVGEYLPPEDGDYAIQVETRKATYLGSNYWDAARAEFSVHIVHEILIGDVRSDPASGCFGGDVTVSVRVSIVSLREENLVFELDDLDGFTLQPRQATIQPGTQQTELTLHASGSNGAIEGEYYPNLLIAGDDGLAVQPSAAIPLHFTIPPLWKRCARPISWGLILLAVLALGGIGAIRYARNAAAPALVTGTLRWWEAGGDPMETHEFDLTALHKSTLTLGRLADSDLVVEAGNLEARHAEFRAEKSEEEVQIYLHPLAEVRKGYAALRGRTLISHGDTFQMGELNFQYLSDSGE
ncbi:MAG: VWA domain-containing protein [Chloroflexota bacterium]